MRAAGMSQNGQALGSDSMGSRLEVWSRCCASGDGRATRVATLAVHDCGPMLWKSGPDLDRLIQSGIKDRQAIADHVGNNQPPYVVHGWVT